MMRLPALESHELAYLRNPQSAVPVLSFAGRLRQRLIASLGVSVGVDDVPVAGAQDYLPGGEPSIAVQPELASAWLVLRLGGKPAGGERAIKDASLADPFKALVRRTLAETVVNAGEAAWPARIRLCVSLGGKGGNVDIAWNSAHARVWARRTIREKS